MPTRRAECGSPAGALAADDGQNLARRLQHLSAAKLALLALVLLGHSRPKSLAPALGLSAPTVYQHLTELRAAGLLHGVRVGRCRIHIISPCIDDAELREALIGLPQPSSPTIRVLRSMQAALATREQVGPGTGHPG